MRNVVTAARARLWGLDPKVLDAVVAGVAFLPVLAPFLVRLDGAHWSRWGYVLAGSSVVPLFWRRQAPLLTFVLILLATIGYSLPDISRPSQPVGWALIVAVYTVAALGTARQRIAAVLMALAGFAASSMLPGHGSPATDLVGLVTGIAAFALGVLSRIREAYTQALEERAAELERGHILRAEQAAVQERARIARDMHDILAHAVAIMTVQAEAGAATAHADPDDAVTGFDAIADAGRDAMAQLRRMLGMLREGDSGSRVPPPTIDALPDLVSNVVRAGLSTCLTVTGTPCHLPQDLEIAVYRVVQEALTNTVKHAAATTAAVSLDWGVDALVITVTDDGRCAGQRGAGRAAAQGPRGLNGGRGLIGIRERAAACGGVAVAGPVGDGGGYRVSASLPLDRSAVAP